MEETIKFFCDEQLGKLARWLRIVGQDVRYEREISDLDLLARARAEARVVLTRDRRLAARAEGAAVVCLAENYPALQLREVVAHFTGRIQLRVFSRCVVCNAEIEEVAKAEVEQSVPPFVFASQEHFTRCVSCGRVFWKATHHDRVMLALKDVLGELMEER